MNGKQIPPECLHLGMDLQKLFEAYGINHSNTEKQINQDMYINGYIMLYIELKVFRWYWFLTVVDT